MLELKLHPEQETFVAQPVKSLAMCYVRGWGDGYDHRPFVICEDDHKIVGYVTIVTDPASIDEYWIDDIMIDASHQGHGYGRAALDLVLRLIADEYPRCETIRLTCFRDNVHAAALYESVGFAKTGRLTSEFNEPEYALPASHVARYRK